jgi:hypothetical protein
MEIIVQHCTAKRGYNEQDANAKNQEEFVFRFHQSSFSQLFKLDNRQINDDQ